MDKRIDNENKCQQCGNNAIVQTGEGLVLCLDCFTKLQHATYLQNIQLMSQMNFLMDQASAITGLDIPMPKYDIPKPKFESTTFNITDSVVGTINTGYTKEIINNMTNIKNQGNEELYKKMSDFLEVITKEKDMTKEIKEEIFEKWAFLSSQMQIQPEYRKKGMIKESIEKIRVIVDDYIRLKEIWLLLFPLVKTFFNF
jgi:hypothetical protein